MRIERIAAAGKDRWRLTFEDGEKLAVTGQEMRCVPLPHVALVATVSSETTVTPDGTR